MDLWDVVRLLIRRWYVSVPLSILTLAAVIWTGMTVSPNHTAEGHIMVLPPTTHVTLPEGEERVLNPWTTDTLAGAVVTSLRNYNLVVRMQEEGHRAAWEVGPDLQFNSVIRIGVTSPTAHEAQAAVSRLLQEAAGEVDARQGEFGLTPGEKITTVVLSAGETTDVVRGNQVRAMVVIFGAFAILTMGVTIGVDALARRRHARGVARMLPAPEPLDAAAEAMPSSGDGVYATGNGARDPSRAGSVIGAEQLPELSMQPGIKVSYRPPPATAARATASAPVSPAGPPDPEPDDQDVTLVLPLSGIDRHHPRHPDDGSEYPETHRP